MSAKIGKVKNVPEADRGGMGGARAMGGGAGAHLPIYSHENFSIFFFFNLLPPLPIIPILGF